MNVESVFKQTYGSMTDDQIMLALKAAADALSDAAQATLPTVSLIHEGIRRIEHNRSERFKQAERLQNAYKQRDAFSAALANAGIERPHVEITNVR
jgi:hypothetical protein